MRVLERDRDLRFDIATLHAEAGTRPSAATTPEQTFEEVAELRRPAAAAEEVAELDARAIAAGRGSKVRAGFPIRAELIVTLALLGIGEDLVGLVDLLEFIFR